MKNLYDYLLMEYSKEELAQLYKDSKDVLVNCNRNENIQKLRLSISKAVSDDKLMNGDLANGSYSISYINTELTKILADKFCEEFKRIS